MKKINFINSVPERQERHLIYWFLFTSVCGSFLAASIIAHISLQLNQYYHVRTQQTQLSRQVADFDTLSAKHRQQIEEKQSLQTRLQSLETLLHNKENPNQLLSLLAKLSTIEQVKLGAITINKQHISLNGQCTQVAQALSFLDVLRKSESVQHVHLDSLQHNKDSNRIINFSMQLNVH